MTVQADIERDRCMKAEHALARARSAMVMSVNRREVLQLLGDLKPGQSLSARVISEMLGWPCMVATHDILIDLVRFGWADEVVGLGKCKRVDAGFRLAHMAIAPEPIAVLDNMEGGGLPLWQPV